MDIAKLPVIDLNEAKGNKRKNVVNQLFDALTTKGFLYLKGIEGYDEEELLTVCKWFYTLPIETRMLITKTMFDPKAKRNYRGFFPVQDNYSSYKESFEMGPGINNEINFDKMDEGEHFLTEDNIWLQLNTPEGKHFKNVMEKNFKSHYEAALEVTRLIAEAWDLDKNTLVNALYNPDHLSTYRAIHYPKRTGPHPAEAIDIDGMHLHCGGHKDSVFLTLLSTFDYKGLQLREENSTKWMDVPKMKDCVVVNIGMLLSKISGGVLIATNHRVVGFCVERYSAPFFMEPSYHADVNIRLPKKNENRLLHKDSEEVVKYGPWLINKIKRFAEYKDILPNFK